MCFRHRLRASLAALRLRRQIFALNFRSKVALSALTPESVADTPRPTIASKKQRRVKTSLPHVVKSNFQRFLIKTFMLSLQELFSNHTRAEKKQINMIYDSFSSSLSPPNENYHKENVSFRLGKQRRRVAARRKPRKGRGEHHTATGSREQNEERFSRGDFRSGVSRLSFWLKNKFFAGLPLARAFSTSALLIPLRIFHFDGKNCFSFI